MLSVKTSSPGGAYHRPTTAGTLVAAATTAMAARTARATAHHVVEDEDQEDEGQPGSCSSLVDSLSSSATTTSSMSTGSSTGLRKTMKSSFALTSLLHHTHNKRDDSPHSAAEAATLNHHQVQPTTLAAAIAADATALKQMTAAEFGHALAQVDLHDSRALRLALEMPLRQARTMRDSCRRTTLMLENVTGGVPHPSSNQLLPMGSWVGLPYASLREERPFLYDHMHTHPLSEVLSQTLNMPDLTLLHQGWNPAIESAKDHQRRVFDPLVKNRQAFQQAYQSFVTSCCIPLLHAAALRGNVFNSTRPQHHHGRNDPVIYRYQVFPTINVVYPNDEEAAQPPTCDLSRGHSVGWLHFHVPLTSSVDSSALHCEHFPGREDWHALRCKQVGLGYCWDGARCLSWQPLNKTGKTRVSLDFRILLVRASSGNVHHSLPPMVVDDDTLCRPHHLQDSLSRIAGFYEEATMDSAMSFSGSSVGAHTTSNGVSMTNAPDARCGFPFA